METYIATDRRVYEGVLCLDMEKEKEHEEYLEDQMKKFDPSAMCTYFPAPGEGYLVFVNGRVLTDNFHDCKQDALVEAITVLSK